MRLWVGLLLGGGLTWLLCLGFSMRWLPSPLDRPNERSLHEAPVPRSGGLAIMLGLSSAWGFLGAPLPVLGAAAAALAVLSLLDDIRGLSAALRLLVHLALALICAYWLGLGGWLVVPIGVAMAWMTNLFNFMDGSDGLAGGMAVFGFSAYALAAWLGGQPELAGFALAVVICVAAFLCFNFHPASLFMGDAGSVPLGFLAGALGLAGVLRGSWPIWFPVLVFSPFIVDATSTLAARAMRREKLWQAHRDHLYQRMVRHAYGHRGTALRWYAVMAATTVSALAARNAQLGEVMLLIFIWGGFYLAVLSVWAPRKAPFLRR